MTQHKFKINHYNFSGTELDDLVHTEAPHFHFQIIRPESEEKREKAIAYLKEHNKIYASFMLTTEILLFLGCTETTYIKSPTVDFEPNKLRSVLYEATNWFREQIGQK